MLKALLLDLRTGVLAAIAGGLSCRRAAEPFGVSPQAIRWRALEREQANARLRALGGDRRSRRIEMHAALILALVEETPDITLDELRAAPLSASSRPSHHRMRQLLRCRRLGTT